MILDEHERELLAPKWKKTDPDAIANAIKAGLSGIQINIPEPVVNVTVKAPQVTVESPDMPEHPQPCRWRFDILRNSEGKIDSFTATPIK
jgi:hypothetical protein